MEMIDLVFFCLCTFLLQLMWFNGKFRENEAISRYFSCDEKFKLISTQIPVLTNPNKYCLNQIFRHSVRLLSDKEDAKNIVNEIVGIAHVDEVCSTVYCFSCSTSSLCDHYTRLNFI